MTSGSKKQSKFQKSDFTEAFIDFIAENDLKEKLSAPFYTQTQIQTPKTEKQKKPVQRALSIDDEKPQMPIELNLSSNKIEKLDTNDSDRQSWPKCEILALIQSKAFLINSLKVMHHFWHRPNGFT